MGEHVRTVSARGGTNGVEANARDIAALGRFYGTAARQLQDQSISMHAYLVSPQVLSCAGLDPAGAMRFQRALWCALDGVHGVSRLAIECTATEVKLRATALAYVTADRLETDLLPSVQGLENLPRGVAGFDRGLHSGGLGQAMSELAAADPQLADSSVDVLSSFWRDTLLLDRVAALPDGRAQVRDLGRDDTVVAGAAPRSVHDLIAGLAWRNRAKVGGDVDVRFVSRTDARGAEVRRVIVDIPGTKNWSLSAAEPDPTSLRTNLKSITGARTTYEAGVLEAMRQAGVGRDEPVLLVGHSQGGLVAMNLATQTAGTGEFAVTNVITAGSPIARLAAPAGVQVLALENDGDVVAHADGASNPDHVNETTVTIHRRTNDALVNHDLDRTYVAGAADVDASIDPSVRSYVTTLEPFLTGGAVRTQVFHVTRR